MMKKTLHFISHSPFTHDSLRKCLIYCGENDSILLLQDGVYAALLESPLSQSNISCYVLHADLAARGLLSLPRLAHVIVVDDTEWVNQVTQHERTMSWA